MLTTEPEAEDKICRVTHPTDSRFPPLCLASGCMHWRWWHDEPLEIMQLEMLIPPDDQGWVPTDLPGCWQRPNLSRRGYCGLAGRPEHG
jgi:hypothetical protein